MKKFTAYNFICVQISFWLIVFKVLLLLKEENTWQANAREKSSENKTYQKGKIYECNKWAYWDFLVI